MSTETIETTEHSFNIHWRRGGGTPLDLYQKGGGRVPFSDTEGKRNARKLQKKWILHRELGKMGVFYLNKI